jgi:hypothetical protein
MQLYFNPPRHLPGRALFKGKRFQGKRRFAGLMTCALVMMIMLLPGQAVNAEPLQSVNEKAVSKKSISKKSASKKASLSKHPHKHHPREKTYMKRKWGVELLFVRETSANYMLEFRYKVLDSNKAKPLFERQTKPVLTHVRTGAKLIVPTPAKTGALRNSNPPKTGKVYWMFFANPGKLVKPGDRVNIDIGNFHANDLVVSK